MKFDLNKKIEITREDLIHASFKAAQKLSAQNETEKVQIMMLTAMITSAIDTELFDTPEEKQEEKPSNKKRYFKIISVDNDDKEYGIKSGDVAELVKENNDGYWLANENWTGSIAGNKLKEHSVWLLKEQVEEVTQND